MTRTTLSNTAERLMQLPKQIQEIQVEILSLTNESNRISESISSIESKIKTTINSEVDANGKKVFSNAEAREAELIERTQFNSDLIELRNEHADLNRINQEKKIEVEALSNEQRNSRSILWFFAGHDDQL
jgi:chromosome segregation ATPase